MRHVVIEHLEGHAGAELQVQDAYTIANFGRGADGGQAFEGLICIYIAEAAALLQGKQANIAHDF